MVVKGICRPKILTLLVDDKDRVVIVGLNKHQRWTFELLEGCTSRVLLLNHNLTIVISLNEFEEKWEVIV